MTAFSLVGYAMAIGKAARVIALSVILAFALSAATLLCGVQTNPAFLPSGKAVNLPHWACADFTEKTAL